MSVHFEVYVRKRPASGWSLEIATENRQIAFDTAHELVGNGVVAAARVCKETLDERSSEFRSVTILSLGAAETGPKAKTVEEIQPLCVQPHDIYTVHARERIGRVLEDWLERRGVTAFELLHRPDLVDALEASGNELQHAIQKLAIPEAQARGCTVHEMIRNFQALMERAVERLMRDHRRGALPDIAKDGFAKVCERVGRDPERAYLIAAGVAAYMAPANSWAQKVSRLLDLADAAPQHEGLRALALGAIEQPLAEILGAKPGLDEILGRELDVGGNLAAMTRMTGGQPVEVLIGLDPSVARSMPELTPQAKRLAKWLHVEAFAGVRAALGRRILRELNGPRRLKPGAPRAEIALLRGLAMALTAAAGKLLPLEDVQAAFSARSKMLTTSDFVETYLADAKSAREETEALIWLTENVIGPANKRQAGRWLQAVVSALRFEKEFRYGPDTAGVKLAILASLQRAAGRCGLVEEDAAPIRAKLGEVGGLIEADARLCAQVAKAGAPALHRLTMLLKLAAGEAAPLGPAADRAKVEALKLARADQTRQEFRAAPEQLGAVRELLYAAGIAA